MKTRGELTELFNTCNAADYYRDRAIFEALLDIRELLMKQQKVTVNLSGNMRSDAELEDAIRQGLCDAKRQGRI